MLKIKLAIVESGYRQNWIAAQLGIDQTLLSRYVSGERAIPENVTKKVAKILKVPIWQVTGEV